MKLLHSYNTNHDSWCLGRAAAAYGQEHYNRADYTHDTHPQTSAFRLSFSLSLISDTAILTSDTLSLYRAILPRRQILTNHISRPNHRPHARLWYGTHCTVTSCSEQLLAFPNSRFKSDPPEAQSGRLRLVNLGAATPPLRQGGAVDIPCHRFLAWRFVVDFWAR